VLGLATLGAGAAQAQAKAPPPPKENEVAEVIVTGTFIAGTPQDGAIPVQAVTLQELREAGSPSNLDLVKTLSEIGSVAGESNRANAFAIGAQSINLRSVSSSRTVVVFNGRRLLEQYSASVGRFNNVALIPNAAIGRVEVLKDGGATTYGADAVGGVVNYITRKNLDGVEVNGNYRWIKDSDGDIDADISMGKVGEGWNAMLVVGYQHRSELDLNTRDWALRPYLINPASWSGTGSPGAYTFQRATGQTITPSATTASGNKFGGDVQMGPTGILRDPNCTALGGFSGWSATPSPLCFFQYGNIQNLVEEQDTWQAYGEANYRFANNIKFHGEALFYKLNIPHTPIDNGGAQPGNFPITPGSATGATQSIGTSAFAVPGSNPAVRDLLSSIRNGNGSLAFGDPNTPGSLANQILTTGRVGLNTGTWRPFAAGGNPFPEGDMQHNYSTTWRVSGELSGDLPEIWGTRLTWSTAVTYNDLHYVIEDKDMLIDRLQAALNGLGGPGCTGATPGANGCQYFNPFSSGIAKNIYTGRANPGFVGAGAFAGYTPGAGLQNSPELVRWLYVPLSLVRNGQYVIVDALLSGPTSLHLWSSDPIAVAVGAQYRRYHEKGTLDNYSNRDLNPCATVGLQTCVSRTGPLVFNRGLQVTGLTQSYDRSYPVASVFFEIRAPITDRLTADVSGRYEKFYSDVSDRDNSVFAPAASLKWQVVDWLALRATGGKSFSQVNPPAAGPAIQTGNVALATIFGGNTVTYNSANYPNLDVKPEEGVNYNVGAIFQKGRFRANLDYYSIKIDNVIRAQTSAQIVNALVQPGQTGSGALINCQSLLLTQSNALLGNHPFVQLNGPCVQGQSALNSTGAGGVGGLAGGTINFFGGQGTQPQLANGGSLETSGLDFTARMLFPDIWGGDLTASFDWTRILTYEASDYVVAGIKVADGFKGVGDFNDTTGRNGQHVARDRGSITFNYHHGRHNLNWSTRYISQFTDDDPTLFTETPANNANIGTNGVVPTGAACVDTNPVSPPVPAGAGSGQTGGNTGATVGYCPGQNLTILAGRKIPATFNTDVSYQLQLAGNTTFTLTVQNLFDQDPAFARLGINYDAYTGSPLGRTVRVGVRKRW
jgi:iron complex outermembrane receptor protein